MALSLDARATELRDFSDMLRNRTDGLEEAYLKHRDRLQDVTETLRKEQEKIGAALDFHKAELETMTRKARDGAEILESTAKNSGEVFLDAVDKALGQAKDLANSLSERSEEAARARSARWTACATPPGPHVKPPRKRARASRNRLMTQKRRWSASAKAGLKWPDARTRPIRRVCERPRI